MVVDSRVKLKRDSVLPKNNGTKGNHWTHFILQGESCVFLQIVKALTNAYFSCTNDIMPCVGATS